MKLLLILVSLTMGTAAAIKTVELFNAASTVMEHSLER